MRLASFDIGIKNLAYCIIDISSSVQIVDWNVINLVKSNDQPVTCNALVKSSSICGRKAKYVKQQLCVCETHAKTQSQYIIPKKETQPSYIKKLKMEQLTKLYSDIHPFSPNPDHKLKKQEYIDAINTYYAAKCFEPVSGPKVSANDVDLISIGRSIQSNLDNIPHFQSVNGVIIENQISTIASRMKTIQGMVAQYFICKFGPAAPSVNIEFVSSSNKLKGFETTEAVENSAQNYKSHKKDSVKITCEFLKHNESLAIWNPLFGLALPTKDKRPSTKKDDLADCFLQGVWYLKSKNIINYAENLKINIV
jgi:hypothetical protein